MSKESFVDFYENHLNSPDGESVRNQLMASKDGDEFLAFAIESGKSAGFDFSTDEAREVMRASEAVMAKELAEASGQPLSDEDLEAISGGALLRENVSRIRIQTLPSYLDKGNMQFSTVMCPW